MTMRLVQINNDISINPEYVVSVIARSNLDYNLRNKLTEMGHVAIRMEGGEVYEIPAKDGQNIHDLAEEVKLRIEGKTRAPR